MARIKFGFGISSISGKVGGSVFAGTNAGFILKNKSRVRKEASSAVSVIRTQMAALQNAWASITESERAVWNSFTSFSPTQIRRSAEQFINGQQLFIKYNSYRLQYGLAVLTSPAFSSCGFTDVSFSLRVTGGVLFLDSSRAAVPAEEFFIVSITGPVRCTLNNPGSRYRQIIFSTTATDAFDLTSAYESIFGALMPADSFVFFKASRIDITSPLIGTFQAERFQRT